MGVTVRPDQMPHQVAAGGRVFRNGLPEGMHCESCGDLVKVEEAYAGLSVHEYQYLYDVETLVVLLDTHAQFTCRGPGGEAASEEL